MTVAYELAGIDMRPRDVLARLVIRLGAPRGIADAVRALERIPGLAFERYSGHDA